MRFSLWLLGSRWRIVPASDLSAAQFLEASRQAAGKGA